MNKSWRVKVLFDGFSRQLDDDRMEANCSCTLIQSVDKSVNIVVDTMTPWDGEKLLKALNAEGVSKDDVNFVISTHGHSDHLGNNNLFLKATHIVGESVSKGETYFFESFPYDLDDDVWIIKTPGHTSDSVSVVVKIESGDIVVVAGDTFEREEDIEDAYLWRAIGGSEDPDKQEQSRRTILLMADFIVPGHGPMFKVKPQHKNNFKSDIFTALFKDGVVNDVELGMKSGKGLDADVLIRHPPLVKTVKEALQSDIILCSSVKFNEKGPTKSPEDRNEIVVWFPLGESKATFIGTAGNRNFESAGWQMTFFCHRKRNRGDEIDAKLICGSPNETLLQKMNVAISE